MGVYRPCDHLVSLLQTTHPREGYETLLGRVAYEGLPEELSRDEQTKEQELGNGADQGPEV